MKIKKIKQDIEVWKRIFDWIVDSKGVRFTRAILAVIILLVWVLQFDYLVNEILTPMSERTPALGAVLVWVFVAWWILGLMPDIIKKE